MTQASNLDVALWGPSQSGKSWLVRALASDLAWYTQHDPEFDYHLFELDAYDVPKSVAPLPIESEKAVEQALGRIQAIEQVGATSEVRDQCYLFKRTAKTDKAGSLRHLVSQFDHRFNVHDAPGEALLGQGLAPDVFLAQAGLQEATFIVALLDLGRSEDRPEAYYQDLNNLCESLLARAKTMEVFLAFCIAKSDWGKMEFLRHPNPWRSFKRLFAPRLQELVNRYSAKLNVNMFVTSSPGYQAKDQDRRSNFAPVDELARPRELRGKIVGHIKYPEVWQAFNVAAPFFWVFETKEQAHLKAHSSWANNRSRYYIPYPPVRL